MDALRVRDRAALWGAGPEQIRLICERLASPFIVFSCCGSTHAAGGVGLIFFSMIRIPFLPIGETTRSQTFPPHVRAVIWAHKNSHVGAAAATPSGGQMFERNETWIKPTGDPVRRAVRREGLGQEGAGRHAAGGVFCEGGVVELGGQVLIKPSCSLAGMVFNLNTLEMEKMIPCPHFFCIVGVRVAWSVGCFEG